MLYDQRGAKTIKRAQTTGISAEPATAFRINCPMFVPTGNNRNPTRPEHKPWMLTSDTAQDSMLWQDKHPELKRYWTVGMPVVLTDNTYRKSGFTKHRTGRFHSFTFYDDSGFQPPSTFNPGVPIRVPFPEFINIQFVNQKGETMIVPICTTHKSFLIDLTNKAHSEKQHYLTHFVDAGFAVTVYGVQGMETDKMIFLLDERRQQAKNLICMLLLPYRVRRSADLRYIGSRNAYSTYQVWMAHRASVFPNWVRWRRPLAASIGTKGKEKIG